LALLNQLDLFGIHAAAATTAASMSLTYDPTNTPAKPLPLLSFQPVAPHK